MSKRAGTSLRDKRPPGRFVPLPIRALSSAQWAALPADAVKALLDLLEQFNLGNNGDLSSGWNLMKSRGWKSKGSLNGALRDLETAGFIVKTMQGRSHRPNLWGCTIFDLDHCGGKLEITPLAWQRSHRGLWSRTPPLTSVKLARADYNALRRLRRMANGEIFSGPPVEPKIAATARQSS